MIRTLAVVVLSIGFLPAHLSAEDKRPVVQSEVKTAPKPLPNASAPAPARAPFGAQQAKACQAAWAAHLGTTVEVANSLGIKLVLIPPGEFLMGSTDEQVDAALAAAAQIKADENTHKRIRDTERPQHRVTIDKPFRLSATEVTIGQFKKFVDATGYKTEAERFGSANTAATTQAKADETEAFDWRWPGYDQTPDDAVSQVTWNDAVAFCNWLSLSEGSPPCYSRTITMEWVLTPASGYRLPTEAEWEFACRAGTTGQYSFGDDHRDLERYGWFKLKSGSTPVRAVGSKRPNPFGLYDTHGNLFEWCQDVYDPKRYEKPAAVTVPDGSTVVNRVMRGGDWYGNAIRCRSAFRGYGAQATRSDDVGIRLVRGRVK